MNPDEVSISRPSMDRIDPATTEQPMRAEERIRSVRRVIDLGEALLDAFAEVADELSAIRDEIADEAYLNTAQDRLASARDRVAETLALLRQWLKEAEANDEGEASE
jgi:hypothetical protein